MAWDLKWVINYNMGWKCFNNDQETHNILIYTYSIIQTLYISNFKIIFLADANEPYLILCLLKSFENLVLFVMTFHIVILLFILYLDIVYNDATREVIQLFACKIINFENEKWSWIDYIANPRYYAYQFCLFAH